MIELIHKLFKHDCNKHREVISVSYKKDKEGNEYGFDLEYQCKKCGKVWCV